MRRARRLALLAVLPLLVASACAHGASSKDRKTSDIHFQLGIEALRNGRPQEALRELDEAIQYDDQNAWAFLGRGITYSRFGRLADAERDYRRAIELNPDFSEAHNALGQLLGNLGREPEAIAEFDRALANLQYGEAFVARCNKGEALYRIGRKEEGLAELRTCLSLRPRYCHGHVQLGKLQLDDGRMKEALDALGKAAEYCDKDAEAPVAWQELGLARMKTGDPERARDAFERCAAAAPGQPIGEECQQRAQALR